MAGVSAVHCEGLRGQVMFLAEGVAQARQQGGLLFPIVEHRTEQGRAKFELHGESEGTRRPFSLVAPVLPVLEQGRVRLVDELDRSLHTLLVRRLVGMFHDPVLNPRGAQLILTTHDTSLLDHHDDALARLRAHAAGCARGQGLHRALTRDRLDVVTALAKALLAAGHTPEDGTQPCTNMHELVHRLLHLKDQAD